MKSFVMEITPAQARAFLDRNTINRPIRDTYVQTLAAEMRRGEWILSHQGIALDAEMRLLDGQHRLLALVEAGVTLRMLVTFDVEPEAFAVMDRGAKRSHADALRETKQAVSVARLAHRLAHGRANGTSVSPAQTATALAGIREAFDRLEREGTQRHARDRSSAAFRLAAVGRILCGQGDHAIPVYRAFVLFDLPALPPIANSMLKQLDTGAVSSRDVWGLVARAWMMFDPARAKASRLQLSDEQGQLDELRAVIAPRILPAEEPVAVRPPATPQAAPQASQAAPSAIVGA